MTTKTSAEYAAQAAKSAATHLNNDDRRITSRLIGEALARGFKVSIYDGEEWAVRRSTDADTIGAFIGATDEMTVRVSNDQNETLARFFLVFGNGDDTTIADCTDNDLARELSDHANYQAHFVLAKNVDGGVSMKRTSREIGE